MQNVKEVLVVVLTLTVLSYLDHLLLKILLLSESHMAVKLCAFFNSYFLAVLMLHYQNLKQYNI